MTKAVITADIVHSSKMTNEERKLLYTKVEEVLRVTDQDFKTKSEIYRGDSFQCLVQHPKLALRVALIIKTFIRSLNLSEAHEVRSITGKRPKQTIIFPLWLFDVRMAIGIGNVEMPMHNLSNSDGTAFQLSGRLLDELKDSKQRFAIASNDHNQKHLEIEAALLDAIIGKATALQCEVIYYKLLYYTETQIAKELNVQQAAVNQRSISGNWNVINRFVKYFEDIYAHS